MVNATPRPLYPRERPGTHCIGGWVDPRAGLDGCGKTRPHRDSIPGPSLYRLSYPGILNFYACLWIIKQVKYRRFITKIKIKQNNNKEVDKFWVGNTYGKVLCLKEVVKNCGSVPTVIPEHFLISKAKEMHYFSDLFDKVLYMFWTGPLSIISSISTLCTRNRYRYLSC